MLTREDIQSFIDRLEGGMVESKELEPGLWRVRSQSGAEVVVHYAPPVVVFRMRVMEPPASDDKKSELFRQLLEFNARDLVHGSYGLEGEHIVLTDALELADRIRGTRDEGRGKGTDETAAEIDALRREVAELAERMDFLERLQAKPRDAERLSPPR